MSGNQHGSYKGIRLNGVRNALTRTGWNARYPNTNAYMNYIHNRLNTYRAHGNSNARTINAARNVLKEYLRRRLSNRSGKISGQSKGHQAEIARLIAALLRISGGNSIHQPFYRWKTYNTGVNVTVNNLLRIATKNAIRNGLGL
jgi:hypothetical protein